MTRFYVLIFLLLSVLKPLEAKILAGRAKKIITPPVGTPSAGFSSRKGRGMEGIAKDLEAGALFLMSGDLKMVFCCVDHLGITDEMFGEISKRVQQYPFFKDVELFVSCSHTHSGQGGFINLPLVDTLLTGKYDEYQTELFLDGIVSTVISSATNLEEVTVGVSYGHIDGMIHLRGALKEEKKPPCSEMCLIRVNDAKGKLFGLVFNFATHPVIFGKNEMRFSPDWIGYARDYIVNASHSDAIALYINGAQGDVTPVRKKSGEDAARDYGYRIGELIVNLSQDIETSNEVEVNVRKLYYTLKPRFLNQTVPFAKNFKTEVNLIVFDKQYAFVTIPGEMFTATEYFLKKQAKDLGLSNLSIFGLTNGAHGYIIPESEWELSSLKLLALGGRGYESFIRDKISFLLRSSRVSK